MNVFYLDDCPIEAANQLSYRHIVKMISESAQMVSTRVRLEYGTPESNIYVKTVRKGRVRLVRKKVWYSLPCDTFVYKFGMKILTSKRVFAITHQNHPSNVWIRDNNSHEDWVMLNAYRMCELYSSVKGTQHASEAFLDACLSYPTSNKNKPFVQAPACVDDDLKMLAIVGGTPVAYKQYMNRKYNEWLSRDKPLKVEFPVKTPDWFKLTVDTKLNIH